MKKRLAIAVIAATLAGCAGGPLAIKTAADAREVTVGGTVYVVSSTGQGTYGAAFGNHFANNVFVSPAEHMTRKAAFTAAIESVTKCKVTDSVLDPAGATLQAAVKC